MEREQSIGLMNSTHLINSITQGWSIERRIISLYLKLAYSNLYLFVQKRSERKTSKEVVQVYLFSVKLIYYWIFLFIILSDKLYYMFYTKIGFHYKHWLTYKPNLLINQDWSCFNAWAHLLGIRKYIHYP